MLDVCLASEQAIRRRRMGGSQARREERFSHERIRFDSTNREVPGRDFSPGALDRALREPAWLVRDGPSSRHDQTIDLPERISTHLQVNPEMNHDREVQPLRRSVDWG